MQLPQVFAALTPFMGWALATKTKRNRRRVTPGFADIAAEMLQPADTKFFDMRADGGSDTETGGRPSSSHPSSESEGLGYVIARREAA